MRVERLGEEALYVAPEGARGLQLQRRILAFTYEIQRWQEISEAVPGMNNVTLFMKRGADVAALQQQLADAWARAADDPLEGPLIEIPVRYGGEAGPDLPDVARRCGCSEADVVAMHSAREYDVYFIGFQPGFAYCGDVDERLRLPRRREPRSSLEAGSVAIADFMTAVYPFRSPGGWHIIGRTAVAVFDVQREVPALFSAGSRVRFVPVLS